mmetsp:Transcript_214/g.468  ORF Transcript_214/g.468 Transcript_214/m.468 type:complete len:238 (-) Transcript_214:1245-1958(-)
MTEQRLELQILGCTEPHRFRRHPCQRSESHHQHSQAAPGCQCTQESSTEMECIAALDTMLALQALDCPCIARHTSARSQCTGTLSQHSLLPPTPWSRNRDSLGGLHKQPQRSSTRHGCNKTALWHAQRDTKVGTQLRPAYQRTAASAACCHRPVPPSTATDDKSGVSTGLRCTRVGQPPQNRDHIRKRRTPNRSLSGRNLAQLMHGRRAAALCKELSHRSGPTNRPTGPARTSTAGA